MNTPSPIRMPRFDSPLASSEAVVVDDDVVADMNLVGVAEHDVLAENHVSAARTEEQRIERLAQDETERPGARLRERHDKLVLQERREARPAHDERHIFLTARSARVEELVLCFVDPRIRRGHSHQTRSYQSTRRSCFHI